MALEREARAMGEVNRDATTDPTPSKTCEHGLHWLRHEGERVCALEYLNRFVAPRKVERVRRSGQQLFLVFDTGERLECCCENCGESHGDDREFTDEIKDVALGRRALRFRLEDPDGHLVVWFARGDHLHLHRNALKRFRPPAKQQRRRRRSVRPTHSAPEEKAAE
ncbi:MAG: hypothetical protein ACRD4D_05105 [Candidatus Acidiferrales bacterium]